MTGRALVAVIALAAFAHGAAPAGAAAPGDGHTPQDVFPLGDRPLCCRTTATTARPTTTASAASVDRTGGGGGLPIAAIAGGCGLVVLVGAGVRVGRRLVRPRTLRRRRAVGPQTYRVAARTLFRPSPVRDALVLIGVGEWLGPVIWRTPPPARRAGEVMVLQWSALQDVAEPRLWLVAAVDGYSGHAWTTVVSGPERRLSPRALARPLEAAAGQLARSGLVIGEVLVSGRTGALWDLRDVLPAVVVRAVPADVEPALCARSSRACHLLAASVRGAASGRPSSRADAGAAARRLTARRNRRYALSRRWLDSDAAPTSPRPLAGGRRAPTARQIGR